MQKPRRLTMNTKMTLSGVNLQMLREHLTACAITELPRNNSRGWGGSLLFFRGQRIGHITPGGRVGVALHAEIDLKSLDKAAILRLVGLPE
jgi:hypothetical protein